MVVLSATFVPLVLVAGAVAALAAQGGQARDKNQAPAADPNPNCTLVVPANPLTAQGLATPYQLVATDRRKGACHEANPAQSAFVEASVLDPATGTVSVYHPLVVDRGRTAAATPATPALPAGAVVGIWFGFNGAVLTLRGDAGGCVNGLPGSQFGQFAYCNAPAFFSAANTAITAKKLSIPAPAMALDGETCPTVRDFSIVDQDQSDNVISSYLVLRDGRTAPNTAANRDRFGRHATVLTNGSDNGLVDKFVDPALGCTPLTAPDLGDPGAMTSSLALNELFAAAGTNGPMAKVPTNDPMTVVGDNARISVDKTNLYRAGVDQPMLANGSSTGKGYCGNMVNIAIPRLKKDKEFFRNAPSPDPAAAKNLFGFLVQRLNTSYTMLGCTKLLHKANPVPKAGLGLKTAAADQNVDNGLNTANDVNNPDAKENHY